MTARRRCPVPGPAGQPCQKHIPDGWDIEDGHPGGHWWMPDDLAAAMDTGHYDASALLAGETFAVHQPDSCHPECPQWAQARMSVAR